jgi:hypothetical protein
VIGVVLVGVAWVLEGGRGMRGKGGKEEEENSTMSFSSNSKIPQKPTIVAKIQNDLDQTKDIIKSMEQLIRSEEICNTFLSQSVSEKSRGVK